MSSKTGFKYVVSKAQYTLSHHISEKLVSDARIIQLFSSPGRLNFEVVFHILESMAKHKQLNSH